MEYKKQGSDSESTIPTANNNVHQRIEYVRPQEEALDTVFCHENIPVNSHIGTDFDTSAGSRRQDLEDDCCDDKTKPPRRPMTSYNIFFLLERERIISGGEEKTYTAEDARNMVALQKWRDVHFKRKHRKSHGMITFKDLSIRAAAAWKKLDAPSKKIFHDCAAVEKAIYARELQAWKSSEKRQLRRPTSPIPRDQFFGHDDRKFPPRPTMASLDTLVAPVHRPPCYAVDPIGYTIQSPTSQMPLVHPDIDVPSMNYHQYYQSLAGLPATIQFPGETNLVAQSSTDTTTLTLLGRRGSGDSLGSWVAKGEEGTCCSSTGSPVLLTRQKTDFDRTEPDAMMDDETVGTFNA
jgi:hypothetical protein